MKKYFLSTATAIFVISLTLAAEAASTRPSKSAAVLWTISQVNAAGSTVTINTGASTKIKYADGQGNLRTYAVRPSTVITLNGLPASLGELKPGMTVDVTIGMDASAAAAIRASEKAPAPEKAPGNAKGKKGNAKGNTKGKGKGPAVTPTPAPLFGMDEVTSVDGRKISVARKGSTVASYLIDANTQIFLNDQPASIAAIHPKMFVIIVQGMNPSTAAVIKATGK